ncbi:hypothetical protein TFLX_01881 [Thermoflexales bacterium]|nr:hypothetical protein TFLX_01881 [Thermoflexales bacterium]
MPPYPEDWLILGGDIGETEELLRFALSILTRRFKRVVWVPGNHDLWTLPSDRNGLQGEAKYQRLVAICRDYGVLTPEDPYAVRNTAGAEYLIAPLFLLYDYSFRPDDVPPERAVEWASEAGIICADEVLLQAEPYASRSAWCEARCRYTETRLQAVVGSGPLVLINHFPLRQDLARLWRIPRFSPWCGTQRTEDWHVRFPVAVVVYGHLHIRGTHLREGVRFEEVSLGYPRDWHHSKGIQYYLREILPGSHVAQHTERNE